MPLSLRTSNYIIYNNIFKRTFRIIRYLEYTLSINILYFTETYLIEYFYFFHLMGEHMITKYRFDEIADIFTGIRVKRYQKGVTIPQKVLKKTYDDSSQFEIEFEEVSEDINPKFYSRKDDIVILLAGSTVSKLEEEGIIIPMYYAVVRVKEGFDVDFIFHLLKSDIFPRELHKIEEGTTLKIIKTTHLKEIKLPVPDYETQVKYGRLFKLMDKRILLFLELIQRERQNEKLILNNLLDDMD